MSIPGSNLLNLALSVISKQTLLHYVNTGTTTKSTGLDVPTYATPVTVYGSFQPVPRNFYEKYGLDLNKTYYTFYTSNNVKIVKRGATGDRLVFQGLAYQCMSDDDWFAIDGWTGVMCVLLDGPFDAG